MRGFASNLQAPPRRAFQAGLWRPAPPLPARPQQQPESPMPPRQRERPAVGDMRRRSGEETPFADRRIVEPSVPWFTSREDSGRHKRRGEVDHSDSQRGAPATIEADLASTIRRLPTHV